MFASSNKLKNTLLSELCVCMVIYNRPAVPYYCFVKHWRTEESEEGGQFPAVVDRMLDDRLSWGRIN